MHKVLSSISSSTEKLHIAQQFLAGDDSSLNSQGISGNVWNLETFLFFLMEEAMLLASTL